QPILLLVIFGTGLSASTGRLGGGGSAAGHEGVSYVHFVFPGTLAIPVPFAAIFGGVPITRDPGFGFLKEVLVAPVPRWSMVLGKALGGATAAMIQGVLILVFAPFLNVPLSLWRVLALLPVVFITAFSLSSLGVLIAARMKSMEGF